MDHPPHQCRMELLAIALEQAQETKRMIPGGNGYAVVQVYCGTCAQSGIATAHPHDKSQAFMFANALAVTTLQIKQLGIEDEVRRIMLRRMAELGITRKEK